jgi:hypothetical protein
MKGSLKDRFKLNPYSVNEKQTSLAFALLMLCGNFVGTPIKSNPSTDGKMTQSFVTGISFWSGGNARPFRLIILISIHDVLLNELVVVEKNF